MNKFKSFIISMALSVAIMGSSIASNPEENCPDAPAAAGPVVIVTPNMDALVAHLSNLPDDQKDSRLIGGLPRDLMRAVISRLSNNDIASLGGIRKFSTILNEEVSRIMRLRLAAVVGNIEHEAPETIRTWRIPHPGSNAREDFIFGDYNHAFRFCALVKGGNDASRLLELTLPTCQMGTGFRNKQSALLGVQAANLLLAEPVLAHYTRTNPADVTQPWIIQPEETIIPQRLLSLQKENIIALPFIHERPVSAFDVGAKIHAVDITPHASRRLRDCCIYVHQLDSNSQLADLCVLTYARLIMRTYPRTMDDVRLAAKAMGKIQDFMFADEVLMGKIADSLINNGEEVLSTAESEGIGNPYKCTRALEPAPAKRTLEQKTQDFILLCKLLDYMNLEFGSFPWSETMNTARVSQLFMIENPAALEKQKQLYIKRYLDTFFK